MEKTWTDGYNGRIGLVATAPGNSTEADFNRYRPEGVAVMTTRTPLSASTPEGIGEMNNYIEEAAVMIGQNAFCDVVLLSSTAGSFLDGRKKDLERAEKLSNLAGCKVITSAECMLKALDVFGVHKITLITPSSAELNAVEKKYFEGAGISVVNMNGFLLKSPRDILCVKPEEVKRVVAETDNDEAEAIVLSCSGLHVMEIIEELETVHKKPVIASNQFGLWGALRAIGIETHLEGIGSLFMH